MNTNIQSQKKAKLQETSAHRVTPPVVDEAFTSVESPRPSKGKEVATLPTTHTDAALEMVRSKQAFMEKNVTDMLTMMRVCFPFCSVFLLVYLWVRVLNKSLAHMP